MVPHRPAAWLPVAGLLGMVALALGWLLLVFVGNRPGAQLAPDAAGTGVEFFRDRGGQRTRADVERLPTDAWRRWSGGPPLTAKRGEALWMRVILRNAGQRPANGVLVMGDFFVDRVEAWQQEEEGGAWTSTLAGEAVPAGEKALAGREVAVPVRVPARAERVVWVRAEDYFFTFLTPAWWPEQGAFHAAQGRGLLAEGIYFGGMLALLGYNVLLWLRLRLADIGFYALYLGAAALFMFLARALPAALGGTLASPGLEAALVVALALSGVFLCQFARVFLDLKAGAPWMDGVARGLRMLMLGLALGALILPTWVWLPATTLGTGATHLGLLALALLAWRRGTRQARYFALSFGCLLAGLLPAVAVWHWGSPDKDAAMRGVMIGSALEMLLLSLAVADRFAQALRDRAAAQAQLVEEAEQRRAVEEAYADELEVEVRERTREIEEANADKDRMLAVVGHDLRSPLVALTQRAEQCRNGSGLAAMATDERLREFSGQVAAAGRDMLLMIEDIVVWARLRTGAAPTASVHPVGVLVMPVVKLHLPVAERRGVALTAALPTGLTVRTDLVLAQTLLRNLVGNAVKFARSRVEVVASAETDSVRITVRDDGPGLPAAVAARLGGEGNGHGNGGGLGLRLSQEIAVRLGVELSAGAAVAGGTEMHAILPRGPERGGDA